MKTTTFKKLLALLASAVLLVCALAGCNGDTAQQTEPSQIITDSIPAGMLVLSTEASVKISYDADGMVLDVTGMNDHGIVLSDTYTDYLGKSCSNVVKELILAASDAGNLSSSVKNIVIKQAVGSALPGSHFLETIATEAEAAAKEVGSSALVTLIDKTGLDEDGYINLDTAKALLANQLGVETLDAYYGSETPTGDSYICTVEAGGIESSHSIDAITGLIADATEEELLGNVDGYEETEYYDYEQEYYEDEFYEELIEEEPVTDETVTTPESTQTGA